MNGQEGGGTSGCMDEWMVGWIGELMNGQLDGEWMDELMDGLMNGWVGRCMNGKIDGQGTRSTADGLTDEADKWTDK